MHKLSLPTLFILLAVLALFCVAACDSEEPPESDSLCDRAFERWRSCWATYCETNGHATVCDPAKEDEAGRVFAAECDEAGARATANDHDCILLRRSFERGAD